MIGRLVVAWLCTTGAAFFPGNAADGNLAVHAIDGTFVKQWLILGPFPSPDWTTDFLSGAGGETNINPNAGGAVARPEGGSATWKHFSTSEDFVSLSAALGAGKQATAYAYCELESASDGEALLQMTAQEKALVWVNHNRVAFDRGVDADSDPPSAVVRLKRGKNSCLIKVFHATGNWEFLFRVLPANRAIVEGKVTDPGGAILAGAVVQLFRGEEVVAQTQTDPAGHYSLGVFPASGSFAVRGARGRLGAWRSDVALTDGGRTTLDLKLEDTSAVSGAILTLDGKTAQTAVLVEALRQTADGSNELVAASALTDERGEYEFVGLKPGRYRVRCPTPNGPTYYRASGDPQDGTATWLDAGERSLRGINLRIPRIKNGFWRTYSTYDGLPHQNVVCVQAMTNGLMYLGFSGGGLCEFDGREFKGIEGFVQGGFVFALERGKDDSLWMSVGDSVVQYDGGPKPKRTIQEELPGKAVRALHVDRDGNLWIGTRSGLSKFDGRQFTNYRVEEGLPGNTIHDIFQARDGAIWLATSGGVSRFDGVQFDNLQLGRGFHDREVRCVFQTRDGALWFGTAAAGVVRYANGEFRRWTTHEGLVDNQVNHLLETEDGSLWLATEHGLSRYKGSVFVNYTRADGLADERVRRLYPGADGTLWVPTADGLCRFDPEGLVQWTEKDGLGDSRGRIPISSIKEIEAGNVWLATRGGILRCDGTRIDRVEEFSNAGSMTDLCRAPNGTLWLAGNGLWKWEGQRLVKTVESSEIRKLDADAGGNIWYGTIDGAWRYQPVTGDLRRFTVKDGVPHNDVTGIRRGQGDTVWIGSYDGIVRFDGNELVDSRDLRLRKSQLAVWTIHLDPQGVVWFGGSYVFGRYDGREFSWPGEKSEASKSRIWSMAQSTDGVLWLATENNGLLGFDPATQVTTAIDPRDGLAGKAASVVATDSRGQIWIGTRDGGLTRYRRGAQRPSVQLVSVEFDDRTTNQFSSPLQVSAGHRLTVNCREIDFKSHPQKRQFLYRVKSPDGTISTHVVRNERRFDWTPPKSGDYEIEVQAIDRDLNYSLPARATFQAVFPWYLNAWIAGPAGSVAFGLLVWAFIARSLYMGKRGEAERLQSRMLRQERQARESLQDSNRRLEEAKETAEKARLGAEEAKEAAEMANRAKSIFLANMSHEIRTPLNAILGYAQILQRDANLQKNQREAVDTVQRSGHHLLSLINEILDLSKIESGRMELSFTDFDLRALVLGSSLMFEARCRQKGVDWRIEGLGDSPIPVHGDEGKIRQVFINLLGNAVKFTEKGIVSLSVERRSGDIFSFRVADTGPGIPLETQQTLFEPFTQGAEGRHKGGTGLGLAISRRQIELMGGELRLESESGRGSCFCFSLRLPPALGEITAKIERTAGRARRLRQGCKVAALVVDDISDNRNVLEHFLKDLGVEVRVVENGEEALRELRTRKYDVAFLDIQMPGLTGIEVVERVLREFGPIRPRLVAVSASVLSHEQKHYAEIGFDTFVPKPFQFEQICHCLEDLPGVSFEYDEEAVPAPATPAQGEFSAPVLPSSLLDRLKHAAEMYSVTDFEALLNEVDTLGDDGAARWAAQLRELSRNIQFDEILKKLGNLQPQPKGELDRA